MRDDDDAVGLAPTRPAALRAAPASLRAGVIVNTRSHRNKGEAKARTLEGVATAHPTSPAELDATLSDYARRGVQLLVVDGGDGTVRDVLTRATRHFTGGMPKLAVLPSGKTNALALDLGAPRGWTLEAALAAADLRRTALRSPLEVWRGSAAHPELRGFLFGTGAFVRATQAAQRAHGIGLFDTVAVGATLASSVARTVFGRDGEGWRAGDPMRLELDDAPAESAAKFMVMASTLERLPLGARPFGTPRPGAKLLTVQAPPKRLLAAVPIMLAGRDPAWLEAAGYRRADMDEMRLSIDADFVLDGEIYPGGDLTLRRGAPLTFVTP